MYKIEDFQKSGRNIFWIKRMISIFMYIILIPGVFLNFILLTQTYINPNEIPSFFGIKSFVIVSKSMEPTIITGDAIFTKEKNKENIKVNDIISFHDNKDINTHRIIGILTENGITKYITKGDNNKNPDKEKVTYDKIEGVYQFKINGFGVIANILNNKKTLVILLFFLILISLEQVKKSKKSLSRKKKRYNYNNELII